jgi:hypothetical protein
MARHGVGGESRLYSEIALLFLSCDPADVFLVLVVPIVSSAQRQQSVKSVDAVRMHVSAHTNSSSCRLRCDGHHSARHGWPKWRTK